MIALNGLEWIDWLHVKNMDKLHRRAVAGLDSWKILDSRSSCARIFSFCLLKPDPRHLMAFSPPINVHLEAYRNINCLLFLLQMPKTDPPHLAANWTKKNWGQAWGQEEYYSKRAAANIVFVNFNFLWSAPHVKPHHQATDFGRKLEPCCNIWHVPGNWWKIEIHIFSGDVQLHQIWERRRPRDQERHLCSRLEHDQWQGVLLILLFCYILLYLTFRSLQFCGCGIVYWSLLA